MRVMPFEKHRRYAWQRRGRGIGEIGAPIPLPGAGLAKGRVQAGNCRQALSCRRLAREDGGTTLATHLRSVLNIIRIVLTRSRQDIGAGHRSFEY